VTWDAATYQAVRPSYPDEVVEWCRPAAPDGLVVELGAGTGKLTTQLVAAGLRMRAFEPAAEMRSAWSAPIPVDDAPAESIPLPDGSASVVVAAQAAHWFDRSRALPEMCRVLVPGGRVVLVWNDTDKRDPWTRVAFAIAKSMSPPVYDEGIDWAAELATVFHDVRRRETAWSTPISSAGLVALLASRSYVADAPNREEILAEVSAVTVPKDAVLRYTTMAWTACRR
jgi:SAM-dependent methyltransferase